MPQKCGGRKIAFSGKQKKNQILEKRDRKKNTQNKKYETTFTNDFADDNKNESSSSTFRKPGASVEMEGTHENGNNLAGFSGGTSTIINNSSQSSMSTDFMKTYIANTNSTVKFNYENDRGKKRNAANRYVLQFYNESDEELQQMKIDARKPIEKLFGDDDDDNTEEEPHLEVLDMNQYYMDCYTFPRRQKWDYSMGASALNKKENKYFTEYVKNLEYLHLQENRQLSYFELNLETWRQLWRVLEISDIILIIVDIRTPHLMFPPSLYKYITEDLSKHCILIFNKIDLVPATMVVCWKLYFKKHYPNLNIVYFSSQPPKRVDTSSDTTSKMQDGVNDLLKRRQRRGKLRMPIECVREVYKECARLTDNKINIKSWQEKIDSESKSFEDGDDNESTELKYDGIHIDNDYDKGDIEQLKNGSKELFKNNILTIGCVGFPNVGKSSVMNALMGKKVVSVSKTPGHTKHFQTIYLTKNVRLCDCPGLVFPSAIPRALQVLIGSYPIAQLKQPFAAIKYLAERIDLVKLLGLQKFGNDNDIVNWSTMDICDGWATKCNYYTTKAARPDMHRAANRILRMVLGGDIVLALRPIGYAKNKATFWNENERATIEYIQLGEQLQFTNDMISKNVSTDDEDEDEDPEDADTVAQGNKFDLLSIN